MKLPSKLVPDPVASATIELQIETLFPAQAAFGVFFQHLQPNYTPYGSGSLPIMQIPEELRMHDDNLKRQPWFRFSGEGISLLLGPTMLAIHCDCAQQYIGWAKFLPHISKVIACLKDCGIVSVTRIGVRYVSFFEKDNIFDKINISIIKNGKSFVQPEASLTTVSMIDSFKQRLTVMNNAKFVDYQQKTKNGSVIDIDVFQESRWSFDDKIIENIATAHTIEKELFFSLATPAFYEKYHPDYEENN